MKENLEKLELKHLAPYLPYELKIRCGEISHPILTCADINEFEITIKEVFINSAYKPILRPLSDLTKEIQVNGEKFVPIDKINEYDETAMSYSLSFYIDCTLRLPYYVIKYLFEWHFDVFGLIEKGLAIDINTLNK